VRAVNVTARTKDGRHIGMEEFLADFARRAAVPEFGEKGAPEEDGKFRPPEVPVHAVFGLLPNASLEYRDQPLGAKCCAGCTFFLGALAPRGSGHCAVVAGPVSPRGHCVAWRDHDPAGAC
jgi:hypothetical protein